MRQYLTGILSDKYNVLALEHGRKLIDFLKSSPKHRDIPIIILSAKSTEEAKIEGLNLGADHYLLKPFSVGELRAVVRSCVKNAKFHR